MEPMVKLAVGESRPWKWKFGAQAIMMVEDTDHSHTFVSWRDPRLDIRYVAEAKGAGIRILSNTQFRVDNKVTNIYHYDVALSKVDELHIYIYKQLAKRYGYKHVLGLFEMRVKNKFYRTIGSSERVDNRFKDGEASQICCELSIRSIEKATGKKAPGNIEDYGLRETHDFNEMYGEKASKEFLDHLNRYKGKAA